MRFGQLVLTTVALLSPIGVAHADGDVVFTVTNNSARTVTGFYATAGNETETSLLTGSLAPGASADVTIAGGRAACVRNLRITFEDSSEQDRPDVDLCNIDGYVLE